LLLLLLRLPRIRASGRCQEYRPAQLIAVLIRRLSDRRYEEWDCRNQRASLLDRSLGLPKFGFVLLSCARFSEPEVENKARNTNPINTTASGKHQKCLAADPCCSAAGVDLSTLRSAALSWIRRQICCHDAAGGRRTRGSSWFRRGSSRRSRQAASHAL